jgi:hypothetical protein
MPFTRARRAGEVRSRRNGFAARLCTPAGKAIRWGRLLLNGGDAGKKGGVGLARCRRFSVPGVLFFLAFLPIGCGGTTITSTGTTADGSGGTTGGAERPDAGSAPLCERYCDAVMANCTSDRAVYTTRDICLAVCATLPPGKEGDDGTNSVECRLRHALVIPQVGEPAAECPTAGPGGNGICGADCDGFCSIVASACPEIGQFSPCLASCGVFPDIGGYATSIQTGHSVECLLYHASAATLDPVIHCPHAAGSGPCGGPTP